MKNRTFTIEEIVHKELPQTLVSILQRLTRLEELHYKELKDWDDKIEEAKGVISEETKELDKPSKKGIKGVSSKEEDSILKEKCICPRDAISINCPIHQEFRTGFGT